MEYSKDCERDGWEPSDFNDDHTTEKYREDHHMNLEVRWKSPCHIDVRSTRRPDVWHTVEHDYSQVWTCNCKWKQFNANQQCKDEKRVQAILDRRKARLEKQVTKSEGVDFAKLREERARRKAEQARRDNAPLNGNRPFKILA